MIPTTVRAIFEALMLFPIKLKSEDVKLVSKTQERENENE